MMKDWLHEINTACKIGNLEALKVFNDHYHERIKENYTLVSLVYLYSYVYICSLFIV